MLMDRQQLCIFAPFHLVTVADGLQLIFAHLIRVENKRLKSTRGETGVRNEAQTSDQKVNVKTCKVNDSNERWRS